MVYVHKGSIVLEMAKFDAEGGQEQMMVQIPKGKYMD